MKIKWALNELKKYQGDSLSLNGTIDLEQSLKKRDSELLSVNPVELNGTIKVEQHSVFLVNLTVSTQITLPSSRSLEPVETPLNFFFSEIYLGPESSVQPEQFEDDEIVEQLSDPILDLRKPLEDAILTNKPTQVFTEEELKSNQLPSGKNWKVLTEDIYEEKAFHSNDEEGDPRFAALKNLFPEEDNEN
ncbi:YceD family protein [Alkalibacterium sp. MB6]|uniref:YceD family protein n=1 Tax=Alkalibacterium sp. MB6 TaxID=2081965 RepID=UPI00137B74AF|nr:YceD family protein [Alkalibacterium sp. MB6]